MKRWILPVGIILCGTVFMTISYEQVLMPRHIMWCLVTMALILCTKEVKIGNLHFFALGYLLFTLLSGLYAVNLSEWLYATLRVILMVSYLCVAEINVRRLSKAMMFLGVIFILYFWCEFAVNGTINGCGGLMKAKGYWAAAHFYIIPFCYYAISKKFWQKTAWCVMGFMAVNILLLNSRSAMLALFVSAIVVWIMDKKSRPYLAGLGLIGLVGAFFFADRVFDNISLGYRAGVWKSTLAMISQNIYGVGAGNWIIKFPIYSVSAMPQVNEWMFVRQPHNDFLWIWSETGLLGIMCYMGMFVLALYYAWKKNQVYLLVGILGYMAIACFSASNERVFASLVLMSFFAIACRRKYPIPYMKMVLPILIFAVVVFGYRFRSSCWNKKLRAVKGDWSLIIPTTQGFSRFSTLTYIGIPYHWWSGVAYLKAGDNDRAVEDLLLAHKYNPYNVRVMNGAGIAYGILGKTEKARGLFSEAIRICPEFENARKNLAKIHD